MKKDELLITGNDKDLEQFEAHLKILAKAGEIPYPISEKEIEELSSQCTGLTLPSELEEKYLSSMKKAYEDLAIDKVKKTLHGEIKVFGRHIQYIRKEANISISRIAERLNKDKDYVEKLESGQLSPLQIAKETAADIMEIFKINLKELTSAIQMFLKLAPMAQTASVHARANRKISEKEMLEDISIAMDDLISIASKKEHREISLPKEFLEGIKSELERRGRTNLI